MEQQNSVEWHESHSDFKAVFDKVTLELGPPDVDIWSGSRSFKVHKKVLEKHSSVLKAKLSDVWQTSGNVLKLDKEFVEPEVVEELLTWMYYTNAGIDRKCSTDNICSLCVAAHNLLMTELVDFCRDILCEITRQSITREKFYDIYRLSKHLNLESLRQNCVWFISNLPSIYFSSPQIVKWTIEELKLFIEESLKVDDSPRVRELILLSFPIWIDSIDERFQELENLLKFVSLETLSSDAFSQFMRNLLKLVRSEKLSSDALFWFMETELYSRLDESCRKKFYVRPYLPEGSSSDDKLYYIRQTDAEAFYKVHCLDLSVGGKWSSFQPENFDILPTLGTTWRNKIHLLGYRWVDTCRCIKIFSTETNKWESFEPLDDHDLELLAAVALDDYIYVTNSIGPYMDGKSFSRYCLKTKQWETLEDMQETRLEHRLIVLDGFVYAIGSEDHSTKTNSIVTFETDLDPRPERYDPQINRWKYITPTNYLHKFSAAVVHDGQIYMLSQAGFEAYSPGTDRWTRLLAPDVCIKPSLVSIAGRLWLLTDSVEGPSWNSKVPESIRLVYEFDLVQREWTRLPDLPKGDYPDFAFVLHH